MALITPQISQILPFDSIQDYIITFTVSGGNQVTQNIINIYKNSDNSLVYSNQISSLILQHIIPGGTLQNGLEYKAQIITLDANNNQSSPSPLVNFWCLSPAILAITNIDSSGKVYNQNVTFSATYLQAQGEKLQQFEYFLYDSNKNLLASYSVQYADGSQPLTQLVQNLPNNVVEYVVINGISVNGQTSTTGYVQFTASYITPLLNASLITQNLPVEGAIEITANIVQVLGVMTSGTENYINSTWIDLTSGQQVTFQNGFNIPQDDFILKLWVENIPDDEVFFTINSNSGHIDLIKYSSQIHALRYLSNCSVVAHFISNTYEFYSGWDNTQGLDSSTSYDTQTYYDNQQDAYVFLNNFLGNANPQPYVIYVKSLGGLMDLNIQNS